MNKLSEQPIIIGVISDTHGLLRNEVISNLRGVDMILHAGDICSDTILQDLEKIAPVYAVSGNCDHGLATAKLPTRQTIQIGGQKIYMLHNLKHLDISPNEAEIKVIVHGHTHQAAVKDIANILYVNPGSVGPRRFRVPVTMGLLTLKNKEQSFEIITLVD